MSAGYTKLFLHFWQLNIKVFKPRCRQFLKCRTRGLLFQFPSLRFEQIIQEFRITFLWIANNRFNSLIRCHWNSIYGEISYRCTGAQNNRIFRKECCRRFFNTLFCYVGCSFRYIFTFKLRHILGGNPRNVSVPIFDFAGGWCSPRLCAGGSLLR